MKVLVIGSGGREHAICRSFSLSPRVTELYCANGNAGIASIARCVNIKPDDVNGLVNFALQNAIDLTFVGGETTLALGIADEFASRGLRMIGPNREATQLEASKVFGKEFMIRNRIPTAKFVSAHSSFFAVMELESGNLGPPDVPIVVKADGLAAGKGVVMAGNRAEAIAAINEMSTLVGSAAADKIVLEECLVGKEVSLLMFADGEDFALMPPTRDHKRIGEGDTGANTGGMGTITDEALLTADEMQIIIDTIIRPTLHGCVREGMPFRGVLFLGLMMTAGGPMLLEYNVRFGDPETQSILIRLETDLFDICEAMINGNLASLRIEWRAGNSACVVLASKGYPAKPRIGDAISGLEAAGSQPSTVVFHAGTATDSSGHITTNGGRVLGVTSVGNDLNEALSNAYAASDMISFEGKQFRRDIGR